jgi:hypothetical protein
MASCLEAGLHLDHVAFLHAVGGDVDPLAVHQHMAVVHELAGGEDRRHELGAVDHRVQAPLQQADQAPRCRPCAARPRHRCGGTAFRSGRRNSPSASAWREAGAEVRKLGLAALAVLAGAVFAAVHRGLRASPDVLAHPAVDLVFGGGPLGHDLGRRFLRRMKGVVLWGNPPTGHPLRGPPTPMRCSIRVGTAESTRERPA